MVEPPEKSGAADVPVFKKKTVSPNVRYPLLPMKASRSPSPSISTKSGRATKRPLPLTALIPKGLVVEPPEKSGTAEVPLFWKKTVLPS